jgi:hypothetical protein
LFVHLLSCAHQAIDALLLPTLLLQLLPGLLCAGSWEEGNRLDHPQWFR